MVGQKVTVGLCVKNAEATLAEAISSILDQDFPHSFMELIVVDGCSRDRTLRIIREKVSKTDLKCRIFSDDGGLGAARQIVVDNAAGDYIVWVDADMRLTKSFLMKQVEFMDKTANAAIAKGKYGMHPKAGLAATLENIEFVVDSSKYMGKINSYVPLGTSGCIYRVKAIRQVKGFDTSLRGVGEDMDAEYRVKSAGWSLYVNHSAVFLEVRRESWGSLWREYLWHGNGARNLYGKNSKVISLGKMFPPYAILTECMRSVFAYKLTSRKVVFLLPLHWVFKRAAWLLGFLHKSF